MRTPPVRPPLQLGRHLNGRQDSALAGRLYGTLPKESRPPPLFRKKTPPRNVGAEREVYDLEKMAEPKTVPAAHTSGSP